LFACMAAVLAYNFFFLPPIYTFTIADPENVVALFFFAVVALIASNLAARVRGQALAARQRAKTTDDLYQFSRKLAVAVTLDDLLWATAHQIALMLKMRVVLLLPEDPLGDSENRSGASIAVRAGFPPEDTLEEADLAAAKWSWEKNHVAGRGSDTLPGAKWLFLPMRTGRGPVGVVGVIRDEPGPPLMPDQQRLLDALTDQSALAIERVTLARDLAQARLQAETDRLRSALLTSISHDLRTPLASILGSATSLASRRVSLDGATEQALLATIVEEADRLNRFIGNLLDMTRLESGALRPRSNLAELSDVFGAALGRSATILARHEVEIDLTPGLPMLNLDMVLFEQVLFNLLDNAAKYAPSGSLIQLKAYRDGDQVIAQVIDEGEGIPPRDVERIFDKFYRAQGEDRQRAGTGLGLAICRGFIEAMGGTIKAANRTDRSGAILTITLPVPVGAPLPEETTT
jgi:two-component system sensor histidine kinase KdpD